MKQYKHLIIAAIIAVLAGGGIYAYLQKESTPLNRVEEAKKITLATAADGIDFSESLYPEEDLPLIEQKIQEAVDKIHSDGTFTEQHLFGVAQWYFTSNDYDGALKLYEAADVLGAGDLDYRINRARIYLKRGQVQDAITELQLIVPDWPVPETYLTLADAYKQLPDTPNQVIDDIYLDGLAAQRSHRTELLEALARWYEATDRGELAIEYYEELIDTVDDPTPYQTRVDALTQ